MSNSSPKPERYKLKVTVYLVLQKEGKVLLSRRYNTGWGDGKYGLPSGHLEVNETIVEAMIRESSEEIGIIVAKENLHFTLTMHRPLVSYMDLFFTCKTWDGKISNKEPNKCDDLQWFDLNNPPENMVLSVKSALSGIQNGNNFIEFTTEE